MPPKNNLNVQLKWLLAEKPFIPSAASLVAYDPNAPESSEFTAVTASQLNSLPGPVANNAPEPEPTPAPVPVPTRPTVQPRPPATRPVSYTVDLHKAPPGQPDTATASMARLRATPGSGRPRLMVAGLQSYDAPPQSSSQRTREGSAKRNVGALATPTSQRSPSRKQRAQPQPQPILQDIEAIDLTSPAAENTTKGKKRKSDEFEEDLRHCKSPRVVRAAPALSPPQDYEGFTHIDDITTFPESPPPPYSTTMQTSRFSQAVQHQDTNFGSEDFSFHALSDDEDFSMPDVQPQATPSNRKRKSLSRVPSGIIAPARKIGNQGRSPSPLKNLREKLEEVSTKTSKSRTPSKRRARDVVMDSEDEEFGGLAEFEPDTKYIFNRGKPLSDASAKSSKPQTQRNLPIRSPSKPIEKSNPQGSDFAPFTSRAASQSPQKKRPSPKKPPSTQTSTLASLQQLPLASELSKEKKEFIRNTAEVFFREEGSRLKLRVEAAISDWAQLKEAFLRQLQSSGADTSGLQEKMNHARATQEALKQLILLQTEHKGLDDKHKELWDKIEKDLKTGDFEVDDGTALNAKFNALIETCIHVYQLLEPAGMKKYLKPLVVDMPSINVKSTQAAPATTKPKSVQFSGSGQVPQTQCVKQTQVPGQELWTSNTKIRFASPPLPMDWNARAQVSTTGKRSTIESRSQNRIPKSPPHEYGEPDMHTLEEDFGADFDDFDPHEPSNTMGAVPEPIDLEEMGLQEENFCDDDDDDAFHEISNINSRSVGGYDWKGDRVDARNIQTSRPALTETSVNRASQYNAPKSPKKPPLNVPGMTFPWSRDVKDALIHRFKLRGFRPGQLEAINATLGGEHCFVLMPTGGGKSLCYQLPSMISSGKTRGVTIVVSPLLSLMEDQVSACKNRWDMQAFLINGESTHAEKQLIFEGLEERDPGMFVQLLYVTPEMLSKNQRMISALERLHRRNRLARIVIDEAHCVSQWGHDFRPDYKALGDVVRQFSGVPIIALTATATQLVRTDVMSNLGIRGGRMFSQSFNRPNLAYEVRKKGKGVVQTIAELIKSRYAGKSGIIYCLSRKTCESVAEKLGGLGIKAYHYHAGMESAARSDVQIKWQANEYHVIVATIAFGMGIDKADVRFVIHHTLPKSLEGYYQETGRAGRDGKRSECYLFYQYADCKTLRKMVEDGDGSREQKQRQHDMLRNVIQFCENKSDCRRAQVLGYFNESFKPENCNQTCDNCQSDATFEETDMTEYAAAAIELVKKVQESNVTLLQCVDAFRGAKNAKLKGVGDCFGFGKDLERENAERVFTHLIDAQALREESKSNKGGWAVNYVHVSHAQIMKKHPTNKSQVGHRAKDYERRQKQFKMQIRVSPRKPRFAEPMPKKKATKSRTEYPSTNVSSPIRAAPKRNLSDFVYNKNEDGDSHYETSRPNRTKKRQVYHKDGVIVSDDEDAEFVPVRKAESRQRAGVGKNKALGPPITVDERIAGLNEFQNDILNGFMNGAKEMIRSIKIKKGLRQPPFSDTILREMGLDLPGNADEMLAIPGINPDMVKLYGNPFLQLVDNSKKMFADMGETPLPRNQLSRRPPHQRIIEDEDEDEDEPMDPNHRNVIDLCSDDDGDGSAEADDTESFYSCGDLDDDDFDDGDDGELHFSHHFNQPIDPSVERFNSRFSQAEAEKPNARPKAPVASKPATSRGGKAGAFKKRGATRRRGSSSFGRGGSYGGVSKRGSRKSGGSAAPSRRPGAGAGAGGGGGGGGGWSTIMAMPT
jgi:bloom syndrome protein